MKLRRSASRRALQPAAAGGAAGAPADGAGGVSFHHGNSFRQSGSNLSTQCRRACALHDVAHDTFFEHPALPYDEGLKLRVS